MGFDLRQAFGLGQPRTIIGYVDTLQLNVKTPITYDTAFYLGASYAPEAMGEEFKLRFHNPSGSFCIRPADPKDPSFHLNANLNPFVWVPDRYKQYLRPGDLVQVTITPPSSGDVMYSIGTLKTIQTINGNTFTGQKNAERKHWLGFPELARDFIGPSFLDYEKGELSRFLKFAHLLMGRGDRVVIPAGPGAGKSTLLRLIIQETLPEFKIVYIGAERPEDFKMFEAAVNRDDLETFYAPDADPDNIRKLHIVQLGLLRAMRLAEMGYHVVIAIDSLTKALARPLNGLGTPSGMGIEKGGYSPLVNPAMQFVLGLSGNYGWGSISMLAAILVENDGDFNLALKGQSIATGHLWLQEKLPYRPAITFYSYTVGGATFPASIARLMEQHIKDSAFIAAAHQLRQTVLNLDAIKDELNKLAQYSGRDKKYVAQAVDAEAREDVNRKIETLRNKIALGVSDQEIFSHFGITYEPPITDPQAEIQPAVEVGAVRTRMITSTDLAELFRTPQVQERGSAPLPVTS